VNFGSEILSWWVVLATFSCKGFTDDSQMIFGAVEGVCQLGRWTSRNVWLRGSRAMFGSPQTSRGSSGRERNLSTQTWSSTLFSSLQWFFRFDTPEKMQLPRSKVD
jgi:hypothetical protein